MKCPFELPVKLNKKGHFVCGKGKSYRDLTPRLSMLSAHKPYIVQAINSHEKLVDSDAWMEKATEFYEDGGCPICFSTDEAGCKKGCYLGQCQLKIEEYEIALRKIIKESSNIDRNNWPIQQQKCQVIAQQALKQAEKS